jgi:hypothetical protein
MTLNHGAPDWQSDSCLLGFEIEEVSVVKAGSPAKENVRDCLSPATRLRCKAGGALSSAVEHLVYTKASGFGPIRPDGDSYGLTAHSSFSAIKKPGPKSPKRDRLFFVGGDNQW